MRHRKAKVTLDRTTGPRQALLKSLTEALVLYEKIETTAAKAKAVKPIFEKVINIGKANDLTARRRLKQYLYTDNAVKKVLEKLAPKYKTRIGGYVRLMHLMPRRGDGAKQIKMELV